jgi:hypothetical protein
MTGTGLKTKCLIVRIIISIKMDFFIVSLLNTEFFPLGGMIPEQ